MNAIANADPSQHVTASRPKILVINDSPEFLSVMRDLLTDEGGYEVATLDQSEGVVVQVTGAPPDLIILDIVFRRGPSGLEIAEELAAASETTGIPVLFCTARSEREIADDVRDLITSRNQRIIYKPFDIDDLLRQVGDMLHQKDNLASTSVV
jgi:CheY-like chemotaxis protein